VSRLGLEGCRIGSAAAAGLVLAAGLLGCGPGRGAAPASAFPLTVRTSGGMVRGHVANGAREFLGIPYAAPPVGGLRWAPPRPPKPWSGTLQARAPGGVCAQNGSPATGVITTSTTENCLFLNIYTPRLPGQARRALPVMVWIHGGGFTGGAGSLYDGTRLATRGHVIVVTINYRLGAFGFLALRSLGAASGDYGLQDQQAALRWVRRNARAFGGNPNNVTIFGESAGGASVCAQLTSPGASGLFQRAIAESGCLFPAQSRQAAYRLGGALAARLGCARRAVQRPGAVAACLRAKPTSAILTAAAGLSPGSLSSFGPVAGTPALPVQPIRAFQTGRFARVPFLDGTNHAEGRFFIALKFDALGHPLTQAEYAALARSSWGRNAGAVLAHYPVSRFGSPDLADAALFTDYAFSCPALYADILAAARRVYAYEFSDPNPPNDYGLKFTFPLGPAHSTELQYVFGRIPVLDIAPAFTPAQATLSDQIIGYWTRFAATGDPNGPALPRWPRFAGTGGQVQELVPGATAPESAATFAGAHQCSFWRSVLLPRG
jgi:para-nitrobenzyl esterase